MEYEEVAWPISGRTTRSQKEKWVDVHRPGGANLYWEVECEPHVMIRFKRLFARIGHQFGVIRIRDSEEVCRDLCWFLDRFPLEMYPEHLEWLNKKSNIYDERIESFHKLVVGDITPADFELAYPAREYQRVAADLILRSGGLLVADDLGLGKTVTAIASLTDKRTRPALVVTLTSLPWQWRDMIHKFAPGLRTHILEKGTPYDIQDLITKRKNRSLKRGRRSNKKGGNNQIPLFESREPFPDIIITNYHKLAGWVETLSPIINMVVFDEVQELRRSGSAKYQAAKHIADHAMFRAGLSATPIYNYGGEMFCVMDVIRPGMLGTWREFLDEWCKNSIQEDKAVVKDPKAFGTYLRDQGLMIRRTREDVRHEIPPIIRTQHHVPHDSKPLDEMKGAASELAKILLGKTGASYQERGRAALDLDWKLRQATGIGKAPYVADFVRILVDSGEKVVLYGWHREVYGIWLHRLRDLDPVMFTGSESPNQKRESLRRFIENESSVLVMSLRAGAGLDGLQGAARTIVFGELDWSPGIHSQCEGRIHRDGQKDSVGSYYLVSEGGSDPLIADMLGIKKTQIDGVNDPKSEIVETLQGDDDRVKKLARSYLMSQGIELD